VGGGGGAGVAAGRGCGWGGRCSADDDALGDGSAPFPYVHW